MRAGCCSLPARARAHRARRQPCIVPPQAGDLCLVARQSLPRRVARQPKALVLRAQLLWATHAQQL